ncbi:MAG: sigma-54-dependent Fis family transcriptional regulator [Spirochaetales bacterium]|nr:sigma-54-dependent Fis family transcriptional regulator [Spirochaetales bacterium]
MRNPILIIDDEPGIRSVLGAVLSDEGFSVVEASSGLEALSILKTDLIDLIFLDVWMPEMGGLDVLKAVKADWPDLPIIMISGHSKIDMAVRAIKEGAFDFVEKPLSIDKTLASVQNALKFSALSRENRELRESLFLEDTMIGEGPAMQRVKELIQQSAATDSRVIVLGENGTGKELVARQIHRQSQRSRHPFVEVNCAAIPDSLIESELFGHEKGAFTSAVGRRKGKFELADGGTLFLDEVADMSLHAQAKVLRAIQEMRFERVGGETTLAVDVRVISATNKDIPKEVGNGRFREDLFYRLNVIPIYVPPLRERQEDLPLLVDYFFKKFRKESKAEVLDVPHFTSDAWKFLTEHTWPGNIRELKNFLERLLVMTDNDEIDAEQTKIILGQSFAVSAPVTPLQPWLNMPLNDAKEAFERALIEEKLRENRYNISKTAQALGLYPSNLHSKLKKFGIETGK